MGITQYPLPGEEEFKRDAFGRFRVSDPITLFESKLIFDATAHLWDDQEESGGSTTSTYSETNARVRLAVANTTAGKRTRQTFRRINYIPGKSQLCLFTGIINVSGGGTGITQGIGLYDDDDGLFFLNNEGTMQVVVRDSTSDTAVAQSSWNIDPMDGTGPSGITADFTKVQIFVIDFEWLGVGRARFGLNIDGITYYVHENKVANTATTVYMSHPNLPIRYQIENDGTGGAADMDHICCTIQSEGGGESIGDSHYISSGVTAISAATAGLIYAIKGIRLKTTTLNLELDITNVSTITTSNQAYEWLLILNGTVNGTFTYADADHHVQEATGITANTNTVTGGTILCGGYGTTEASVQTPVDVAVKLGAAIDGTRDEILLCVRPIQNNTNVYGGLVFKEKM